MGAPRHRPPKMSFLETLKKTVGKRSTWCPCHSRQTTMIEKFAWFPNSSKRAKIENTMIEHKLRRGKIHVMDFFFLFFSSAKSNDRTACTPLRVLLLGKNNELLASLSFNDCISRESLTHDDCLVKLERSGREELNWPNRAQRHTGLRPGSKRKNAHGHETNTKTYNDLMIEVDIAFGTHFRNYSTAKPSSPQPPQSWSRLSTNYIEAKYVSWISISSALHIAATPAGRTEKVVHVALSSAKASMVCASCE
jgi:hypothetical protein